MKIKYLVVILLTGHCFGGDLSNKYLKLIERKNEISTTEIKKLVGNRTIVFIPGILSETVIEDSSQIVNFSYLMGDYFKEQLNWCATEKIKCQRIILESEASVDVNSLQLRKSLSDITGELIVISHSKGGLEFLNVLLNDDDIRLRTHAWIAMQSPFKGAVATEIFLDNKILKKGVEWLFSFLGGSSGGVQSISVKDREGYIKLNTKMIEEKLRDKKFLQYGSYIKDEEGVETILGFTRDYIMERKGNNDGLVELSSTTLNVGDFVHEEGVDHLLPVLNLKRLKRVTPFVSNNKNWNLNRAKMLKNLLYMVLND
ncbi:hypothetical protein [Bacteriovorax sp. Seq25_V]|uniref:hypothetical protein n=1 Tax=Bacteriovorax sp. Seq25_V TaxID=1201288 RepID=UPI00038A455A|nr:hypothetical protein [Bacteriovorax sp. Seq25_V]EQC46948.1 hypothetical protein M900_2591 [Bacteriovorax sp. Seq25_V]